MGTVLRFIPATQFTDVPLSVARAPASRDAVARSRSACCKADIDPRTASGRDLPDVADPGLGALNGRIGDANRSAGGQLRSVAVPN